MVKISQAFSPPQLRSQIVFVLQFQFYCLSDMKRGKVSNKCSHQRNKKLVTESRHVRCWRWQLSRQLLLGRYPSLGSPAVDAQVWLVNSNDQMATKENFLPIFYYEFFAVRAVGSPGDRPVRKGQEFEKCYNFTTVLQSEEEGRGRLLTLQLL